MMDMTLWRNRFVDLLLDGRAAEVTEVRQLMYASLGQPFQPVDPSLHDLLSQILLNRKLYPDALAEVDYALSLLGADVHLLNRRSLILIEQRRQAEALQFLTTLTQQHPELAQNADVAGLEGRIYRELWQQTNDSAQLDNALAAYKRAYDLDNTQLYPAINVAELAFAKGDETTGQTLCQQIITQATALRNERVVSYWTDFAAGEAHLGLRQEALAVEDYRAGVQRTPAVSLRDWDSALAGAQRMVTIRKLPTDVITNIQGLWTAPAN
jgi:tetratricopeptide (TPR) repeat protein